LHRERAMQEPPVEPPNPGRIALIVTVSIVVLILAALVRPIVIGVAAY
jgi:hypothetical protein